MMNVRVCDSLRASRAQARTLSLELVASEMLSKYGKHQLYEFLSEPQLVKPYFDLDLVTGERDEDELELTLARARVVVERFFADQDFSWDGVLVASSHGPTPRGYKISYRIIAPGFRATMAAIKARLQVVDTDQLFDVSPYGRTQKLRAVGSYKDAKDRRVMDVARRPLTEELLTSSLVQVVSDDDTRLHFEATKRARAPLGDITNQRDTRPEAGDARMLAALSGMGFTDVTFRGRTGAQHWFDAAERQQCPCCSLEHTSNKWWASEEGSRYIVCNYSNQCQRLRIDCTGRRIGAPSNEDFLGELPRLAEEGGWDPSSVQSACMDPQETHSFIVPIVRDDEVVCAGCGHTHIGGGAAYELRQMACGATSAWYIRDSDVDCRGGLLWCTPTFADAAKQLASNPVSVTTVASFFARSQGKTMASDANADKVKEFREGRWRDIKERQLRHVVEHWCHDVVSGLAIILDEPPAQLLKFVSEPSNLPRVLESVKGHYANMPEPRPIFNSSKDLLGVANGVIDLVTGTFRAARVDDYVTLSTGFPFEPPSDEALDLVHRVFRDIYPEPSELNIVHRFAGYILSGSTTEKYFLALTDRRRGDNGKSTVLRLLCKALGEDYAVSARKGFIYKSSHSTSLNGHDSGMKQFKHKRLAVFEELDKRERIDMSQMKEVTGGGATFSVRGAYERDCEPMLFEAKLILVFNQGNMPKLDVEDDAFMKRLLLIEHRAAFAKNDKEYLAMRGQPHSHRADPELMDRLQPSAILAWMLQGLAKFRAEGFNVLPEQLEAWKMKLMTEVDEVRSWISEHVYDGLPEDVLEPRDVQLALAGSGIRLSVPRVQEKLAAIFPDEIGSRGRRVIFLGLRLVMD